MSLYGYKRKGKPANWTLAFPRQVEKKRVAAPTARQKPVPARLGQSKAGRARLTLYRREAVAFLADPANRLCKVCGRQATEFNTIHVHHIRGRAGALLTDARYFAPVHDYVCHPWIHNHPESARDIGLLAMPGEWGKV